MLHLDVLSVRLRGGCFQRNVMCSWLVGLESDLKWSCVISDKVGIRFTFLIALEDAFKQSLHVLLPWGQKTPVLHLSRAHWKHYPQPQTWLRSVWWATDQSIQAPTHLTRSYLAALWCVEYQLSQSTGSTLMRSESLEWKEAVQQLLCPHQRFEFW